MVVKEVGVHPADFPGVVVGEESLEEVLFVPELHLFDDDPLVS